MKKKERKEPWREIRKKGRKEWKVVRNQESRDNCSNRLFTNRGTFETEACSPGQFLSNTVLGR